MAPYSKRIFPSGGFVRPFDDLRLKPQIGRGRESRVGARPISFLNQVKLLAKRYWVPGKPTHRYIGRGGGLRSRGKFLQRVVIKTRSVRNRGKTKGFLEAHMMYLQREGAGIDGTAAEPFTSKHTMSPDELTLWTKNAEKDRHHFRFILSPENGSELDLKAYAQNVMRQMERDLDTKLSWVAVTHHNTDNPHVHLLVRGIDQNNQDLVINRDYLTRGARIKAQEIATRELGFRRESDIALERQKSITQGRIVGIDHELIKQATWNSSGLIDMREAPPPGYEAMRRSRSLQLGRLNFLESLGLAEEVHPGLWELGDGFLDKLHSLGIRNDIIKTMHRRMRGINPDAHVSIFEPTKTPNKTIEGKILYVGLENELYDTNYLMLEDKKRQVHYVSLAAPGTKSKHSLKIGDEVKIGIQKGQLAVENWDHGRDIDLGIERK